MPRETRAAGGKEEEMVSLVQVREMMDQQKKFFTELLEQQERNFKTCVQIMIDASNKRVDGLTRELGDLRESVHFTQKDVDDLRAKEKVSSKLTNELKSGASNLEESLMSLTVKSDYLEGQSRRNNIIIDGIGESPNESWSVSEDKVRRLISEKLQLDHRAMEIERAHRMGKPTTNGERPRPIIAKLFKYKDKLAIMENANKLKGSNIFINEDYTEAVRLRRKELLPDMKAARARGDIAYLRHDKLVVHPANRQATKDGQSPR